MFYCNKCNYMLDITKTTNLSNKNKLIIETPDEFYKKIVKGKKSNLLEEIMEINFEREQLLNYISKNSNLSNSTNQILSIYDNKKNSIRQSKFIFKCKNCSNEYQLNPKQVILSLKLKKNSTQNNILMQNLTDNVKDLIINDNTYFRTKNFICQNIKCSTHKENTIDKEAIIFRPNPNTFLTYYLCTACKTVF